MNNKAAEVEERFDLELAEIKELLCAQNPDLRTGLFMKSHVMFELQFPHLSDWKFHFFRNIVVAVSMDPMEDGQRSSVKNTINEELLNIISRQTYDGYELKVVYKARK